jgi:hypothetical protein
MKTTPILSMLLLLLIGSILVYQEIRAAPVGPQVTVINNSTISSNPAPRADAGGYIYYTTLTATQQDYSWKAYVGNVSGSFTLDDANGNTIYDWPINSTLISGEVYATRNSSITWTWINCTNTTVLLNETAYFGFGWSAPDNINNTFNNTIHKSMVVGTSTIPASSCPVTYTYVNDTQQDPSVNAFYQELVLMDAGWHQIYATFIDQDKYNYQANSDSNETADFQMIIPENSTVATPTTYYFYVEIGS